MKKWTKTEWQALIILVCFVGVGIIWLVDRRDFEETPAPAPMPVVSSPADAPPTLTPEQREPLLMMESNGLVKIEAIDAAHNTVWINSDLWARMPGQLKEDSAAIFSKECAMRDHDQRADIEIRDMQSATLLATWKWGLLEPKFTVY